MAVQKLASSKESGRTRTIWVTGKGVRVPVASMSDGHLANTLNLIHRKADQITAVFKFFPHMDGADPARQFFLTNIPTYPALVREATKRKLRVTYHADPVSAANTPKPTLSPESLRILQQKYGRPGPCVCGNGYDDNGDGNCPACIAARVVRVTGDAIRLRHDPMGRELTPSHWDRINEAMGR